MIFAPRLFATAASLFLAGTAFAQGTRFFWEASADGGATYSSNVNMLPGQTVYVRVRAVRTGTETVLGLSGFTFQPTLTNWDAMGGDQLRPWVGEHVTGLGTPDVQQNTGRIAPFGQIGQGTSSASGALVAHNDPGNILRIAGANAILPTATVYGIAIGQRSLNLGGTNFNSSLDVVVFRYAIQLGPSNQPRTLEAKSPASYMHASSRVSWHQNPSGASPIWRDTMTDDRMTSGFINVIPVPGAALWACVGSATVLARPRRRTKVE